MFARLGARVRGGMGVMITWVRWCGDARRVRTCGRVSGPVRSGVCCCQSPGRQWVGASSSVAKSREPVDGVRESDERVFSSQCFSFNIDVREGEKRWGGGLATSAGGDGGRGEGGRGEDGGDLGDLSVDFVALAIERRLARE